MFQINKETKTYIIAPSIYFNGGAELLHQLCDVLNRNNMHAYMCYFNGGKPVSDVTIPDHLRAYQLRTSESIDDEEQNVVICPEKMTEVFWALKKVQKCIWWLGMNQFFWRSELNNYPTLTVCYHWLKYFGGVTTPLPPYIIRNSDIRNLSQCWYGASYLNRRRFHNVGYLSDYISFPTIPNCDEREDIVLYNPKRNIVFLKRIMSYDPSIRYIPIENLTKEQVSDLMVKSKLYIDFGSHPGKDRLPREAALHGCCILTSTEGSADFWNDMPIDSDFKFERKGRNIKHIHRMIKSIMNNYEMYVGRFEGYRKYILSEKECFEHDVMAIFKCRESL